MPGPERPPPTGALGPEQQTGIHSHLPPETKELLLSSELHYFFFHRYGRRVGMVPRSSLKGGKNSQMVQKETEKPNTTPNKQNTTTQGPQAESPPSCTGEALCGGTGFC